MSMHLKRNFKLRCNCCNYSSGGFDTQDYGEAYRGAKIRYSERFSEFLCSVCEAQITDAVWELTPLEDTEFDGTDASKEPGSPERTELYALPEVSSELEGPSVLGDGEVEGNSGTPKGQERLPSES